MSNKVYCGFDTETTGINTDADRIVTANITVRDSSGDRAYDWLINPGVEIPKAASDVHGVSNEVAQEQGADPKESLDEIAELLATKYLEGAIIVIYNAVFDLPLLKSELERHGLPTLEDRIGGPVIRVLDPLVLDRSLDKYRKGKRTLTKVCAHYGVDVSENAHEADADVRMTLDLLGAMGKLYRIEGTDEELYEFQSNAYTSWAENLGRYFRRIGQADTVRREWV